MHEGKIYKPNCVISLIIYALMVMFFIFSTIITFGLDFKMLGIYLLCFLILVSIELIFFNQAVRLDKEELKVWNGAGYFLKWRPIVLKYQDIIKIKEVVIPISLKFSHLKIYGKEKKCSILFKGVKNYEDLKRNLLARIPQNTQIELKLKKDASL